jgi:DnaJ-domain-containing protein 1
MGASSGTQAAADFSQVRSGGAGYFRRTRDPFNLFGSQEGRVRHERKARPLEAKALETLGLDVKATGADIKARYKELVKRHHPDANGGNRGSEDRFREVIQAYRLLRQAGLC